MVPVVIMLVLVCLLGVVTVTGRMRVAEATRALGGAEHVEIELSEIRSLSRSLQRDALNFVLERDPAELRLLHTKYNKRSAEMTQRLASLRATPTGAGLDRRTSFFRTQATVIDRLDRVERLADRNDLKAALAAFRQQVRPNERAASAIADQLIAEQEQAVARAAVYADGLQRGELLIGGGAALVLSLLAAFATFTIIMRSVVTPFSDIVAAMGRVVAGEIDGRTPHEDRQDEIGRMARAIEVFRAAMRERERLQDEAARTRTDVVARELEREQASRQAEALTSERSRAIAVSAQQLEQQVAEALTVMRATARQLAGTSATMDEQATRAADDLTEVEAPVGRAVEGATDIASATGQFMSALEDARSQAERSAGLSADANAQSEVLAERMTRVREDARAVGDVVSKIHSIAQRTNLLALNASIEAARVGEAGRGFGVVAEEVKALAAQTARAADEIAVQISGMQQTAQEAGASLGEINRVMGAMAASSRDLVGLMGAQAEQGRIISHNVSGAAADLDVIGQRVTDVHGAARGVNSLAAEVRHDAGELHEQAGATDGALFAFFDQLHTDAARAPTPAGSA